MLSLLLTSYSTFECADVKRWHTASGCCPASGGVVNKLEILDGCLNYTIDEPSTVPVREWADHWHGKIGVYNTLNVLMLEFIPTEPWRDLIKSSGDWSGASSRQMQEVMLSPASGTESQRARGNNEETMGAFYRLFQTVHKDILVAPAGGQTSRKGRVSGRTTIMFNPGVLGDAFRAWPTSDPFTPDIGKTVESELERYFNVEDPTSVDGRQRVVVSTIRVYEFEADGVTYKPSDTFLQDVVI